MSDRDPPHHVPATVVVGAGLAGLFAALKLAPMPVTVISPAPLGEAASSSWAQGGIAAAVGIGDTPAAHAKDTARAGAGLVDEALALSVANEAGDRVQDLLELGVPFDQDSQGRFLQSREAAHSEPRVVRVTGDRAGAAIMKALIARVLATPSITLLEGYCVVGLTPSEDGAIDGVVLARLDAPDQHYHLTGASDVILATGGVGGLYATSTNPPTSTGRGIALAARAGAVIADAEFVQFHPTAIDVGKGDGSDGSGVDAINTTLSPAPLASEALRGEGSTLVNNTGVRFMVDRHDDGELAPRDVVARAVFDEISSGRGAFLDCREAIGAEFPKAFPTIFKMCQDAGLDPVADLIPVRPAEHYHMGGIKTDATGATTVTGLWAIGEVAATGLHGANRLASNSLLEAVVFAERAAKAITTKHKTQSRPAHDHASANLRALPGSKQKIDAELRLASQIAIRAIMDTDVGVVRDRHGLTRALGALGEIQAGANGDLEIENMTIAARFIAEAALRRKESRGAHHRSDYPSAAPDNGARRITMTLAGLDLRARVQSGQMLTELMQSKALDE